MSGRLMGAFLFTALSFALAVALGAAVSRRAVDRLAQVRDQEAAARAALRLAAAAREVYVQQAHAIIAGGEADLSGYAAAAAVLDVELSAFRRLATTPADLEAQAEIAQAARRLDLVYRNQVLPAIAAGDWAKVRSEHDRAYRELLAVRAASERLEQESLARVEQAEAQAQRERRAANLSLASLFGAALLASLLAAIYVSRSVTRPLVSLAASARRIGAGDLSARVDVSASSSDEVGELSRRFNEMAERLREHQDRLVSAEKLAALGRLAAGVAHELNNPLGVALGYVRLLKKSAADERTRADLEVVDQEMIRAHQIVQELLGMARDSRQQRSEPVDLGRLASEAASRHAAAAPASCPVEVEGPMPTLQVLGDPDRLSQVLSNLIRNAAEAAGPSGRVVVRGANGGQEASVTVEDSGPGIPEEVRARLFEPFFTTKERGLGLGLAVSLAIAQAHRGTIHAENRPGGGARFTLKVPAASPAAESRP